MEGPKDPALVGHNYRAFQRDPLLRLHADFAFERKEQLGSGGMGAVYRVLDHRTRREAALKVLLPERRDPRFVERFIREARITAALDHPGIPPVYEFGRAPKGEPYILLKLIRGRDLGELIERFQRLSGSRRDKALNRLLSNLVKVCEALAYCHEKGVLHRDLKPANIRVGKHGEVYVMDWGIARDARESRGEDQAFRLNETQIQESVFGERLSKAGSVVGTPAYLAPEQAAGKEVDARADIYSMGAILHELMSGRPPLSASGIAGVVAAMEGRIDIDDALGDGFPPSLGPLVRRCLSRDRELRPENAAALMEGLRLAQTELIARPQRKRRQISQLLILALALTGLTAGGLGWRLVDRAAAIDRLEQSLAEAKARPKPPGPLMADQVSGPSAASGAESGKPAQRAAELRERARRLLAAKDRIGALLSLDRAIALDGSRSIDFSERGRLRYELRDFQGAARDYAAAARLDPTDARLLSNIGAAEERAGNLAAAEAAFTRALALDTRDHRLFRNRGRVAFLRKRNAEAERDFSRALELDPDYFDARISRGILYERSGRYQEALRDYNAAALLRPNSYEVFLNRSNVFALMKRYAEAARDQTRALAIKPEEWAVYFNRAVTYARLGRVAEAIADYDLFLARYPRDALAYFNRALAHERLGQIDAAVADLTRSLELDPRSAQVPAIERKLEALARRR